MPNPFRISQPIPLASGVSLVALGLLGLAGWVLHVPVLVQILPGLPAMTANTAISFLLAGAALLLPAKAPERWRYGQAAIGTAILTLALTVLSQDLIGIDLGIDRPLHAEWLSTHYTHATRMAPNTAIAFALAGLCLILSHRLRHRRLSLLPSFLSNATGIIGLVALVGYVFQLEFLFSWYAYTRMAAHTAAGLLVLGIGLWFNNQRIAASAAAGEAHEDRYILITATAILVAMAVLSGMTSFLILERQTDATYKRALELTLLDRIETFRATLDRGVASTLDLAARPTLVLQMQRLAADPGNAEALGILRTAAGGFLNHGFNAIGLRDAAGKPIVWVRQRLEPEPAMRQPFKLDYRSELLWRGGFVLRLEVPVTDDHKRLGTLVTEWPMTPLTRQLEDIHGIGESGEMVICAAHGSAGVVGAGRAGATAARGAQGERLVCFPSRFMPQPYDIARVQDGQPLPMSHALDSETGIIAAVDYRHHNVIAAYGPIGDTGLGMVVKMDAAELYRPVYRQLERVLILLVVLVVAGFLMLRWRLLPLVRRLVESRIVLNAANTELAESEERIRAIIESTSDAVYIKGRDGRYLLINSAGASILGRRVDEILGKTDTELFPPESARQVWEHDRQVLESGKTMTQEDAVEVSSGRRVYLSNRAPYRDTDGNVIGVVGIARDITERKHAEETVRSQSLTDELTGLYNRRGFLMLSVPLLGREARMHRDLHLFFADLDGLKRINDTFGHALGDQAIRDAAQVLRETFRESDVLGRMGGDEFAALAPDMHPDHAEKILARIEERVAAHNRAAGRPYRLSITVGVVRYDPATIRDIDALLARGDAEMYSKKKQRRA